MNPLNKIIGARRNISDHDPSKHFNFNIEETCEQTEEASNKLGYKIISNLYYRSQAGTNDSGITKTNQDSHVVAENVLGFENYNIFGVLDGHGK
jgi:hypothetical protein